jgi:hypothetical protein
MQWDWDLLQALAKAVGSIIGVAAAGYQAYRLGVRNFRSRTTLKRDLDILKMVDQADPGHAILKAHVDRMIRELYAPPAPSVRKRLPSPKHIRAFVSTLARDFPKPKKPSDFVSGLLSFVGFSVWTAYLDRGGFSWWSLLTGVFALSGLLGIFDSYGLLSGQPQRPDSSGQPSPSKPPSTELQTK